MHSIDVDYEKDLMYVQGWGGTLSILDISSIEKKYQEEKTTAFEVSKQKVYFDNTNHKSINIPCEVPNPKSLTPRK